MGIMDKKMETTISGFGLRVLRPKNNGSCFSMGWETSPLNKSGSQSQIEIDRILAATEPCAPARAVGGS